MRPPATKPVASPYRRDKRLPDRTGVGRERGGGMALDNGVARL